MGKFEGKIALVTGGNSGIGLATAKEFVGEGAYVFITGRRDHELATAVKETIGKNVTAVRGDVSKLGDFDRLCGDQAGNGQPRYGLRECGHRTARAPREDHRGGL